MRYKTETVQPTKSDLKRDEYIKEHLHTSVFWGFLEPPTTLRKTISLHKVRKNCHFLNPPHPYILT